MRRTLADDVVRLAESLAILWEGLVMAARDAWVSARGH